MSRLLLSVTSLACYSYLFFASCVFELHLPFYVAWFLIMRKGRFDDALRIHNTRYGLFFTRVLWPFVRVSRSGLENVPATGAVMAVYNHRSALDIIFACQVPRSNATTLVRSWPFRLPAVGTFMRLARYMNIDTTPFDDIRDRARELTQRGVSWMVFPEGHRSRDGKMRKLRSGAFVIAVDNDLPIIPVCMTGTERFCAPGGPFLRPAHIHVEILPPIYPSSFPEDKRPLKLRRHVESVFKEHFDE